MSSKLKAKSPEASTPSRPKVLVFGAPGVGKTWTALDFPGVYYIDVEGGAKESHYIEKLKAAGGVYMGPEDGANDFRTVIDQIAALATEKHSYKTVVIDSFSKLFNTTIANEAERLDKEGIANEFARDKKPAVKFAGQLVMWADRMDLTLILICHQMTEWGKDAKGTRTEIGHTFDGWLKLEFELGLCLHITKAGGTRKARVRKTRIEAFPDASVFDWSYAEFAKRFGRERLEAIAEPVQIVSEEDAAELKRLIGVVNTPEGEVEKWLSKAKATRIEELSSKHAADLIAWLKSKVS